MPVSTAPAAGVVLPGSRNKSSLTFPKMTAPKRLLAVCLLTLCGKSKPIYGPIPFTQVTGCSDSLNFAVSVAQERYAAYRDSLKNNFDSLYRDKCLQAYKYESFTVTHTVSEYHYTLYRYNSLNQVIAQTSPDGGASSFYYDQLRGYRKWANCMRRRLARYAQKSLHF